MRGLFASDPGSDSSNALRKRNSVFRSEALRRYVTSQTQPVLPRMVAPPTTAFLWLLLTLLFLAMIVAWSTPLPTYQSGIAMAVAGSPVTTTHELNLIAFLPANAFSDLRPGQSVLAYLTAERQPWSGEVHQVEPVIVSPAEARARYGLGVFGTLVTQPSAVIWVRLSSPEDELHSNLEGSILPIKVQVGSRSLATLLPLIGQLFD